MAVAPTPRVRYALSSTAYTTSRRGAGVAEQGCLLSSAKRAADQRFIDLLPFSLSEEYGKRPWFPSVMDTQMDTWTDGALGDDRGYLPWEGSSSQTAIPRME